MEDIELVLHMQKNDLDALEELMQRYQRDRSRMFFWQRRLNRRITAG